MFSMKRWLYFIIAIVLFAVMTPEAFAACGDSITGGSGTVGAPYLISTPTELAAISNCLGAGNSGKYFKMDADIDLNVSPYNTGTGWTPIGTSGSYFYGKFDGDFKTISNLYYNSSGTNNVGLFGYVASGATISNLLLNNAVVTGNVGVGALVGSNTGAISKVSVVDGSITGFQRTGGLVGSNYGSMTQTYSDNTVYFTPTGAATCCFGGLAGEAYSGGTINNSYSRSNIVLTYSVANQGSVGGLYGNDYSSGTKTNLYSTGSITMVSGSFPSNVGGLAGSSYTNTTSSYWDTETSGRATSGGGAGVVGKTTSQMKTQGTYSGWDFSTIWAIDGVNNDGYPYLLWQDYSDVTAPTITNVSSDKTNGSYTVGEVIDIDVTFSEVVTSTGDVTVTLETGDTDRTCTFSVTATTTGTCNYTVQAGDTSADLTVSSISGTIADASANAMSNFVPTTNLAANKALVIDTTAPIISTLSPADNATGVSATANLILTFDTAVDVETGNITIKKSSDDSTIETIDVTSGLVTGTGTTIITINPNTVLSSFTQYYIQIDATAFDDTSGNSYAGISDTTSWSFTTADTGVPAVSSLSPLDGAIDVDLDANLVITFDEIVDVETGNISLYKSSDDSLVQAMDVTGLLVTGTGTTIITINPTADFEYETEYYVQIDATAFDDTSGNSYAGISDATTWSFTTESEPVVEEDTPRRSPGSSVARRVRNLTDMGNIEAANVLINQYPNQFTDQQSISVVVQSEVEPENNIAPIEVTSTTNTKFIFNKILRPQVTDPDVVELQKFLNANGFTINTSGPGSRGSETSYFGILTQIALKKFQEANKESILEPAGLTSGTGVLGPHTQAFINTYSLSTSVN